VKNEIIVLDGDQTTGNELRSMLAGQPYSVTLVKTLTECEDYIEQHACFALILDLDTVSIDNRSIGRLKKKHPGISIIAKSDRTFHPELEESLRNFIFACLTKPLDSDELNFWLKSLPSVNGCS
jgi:DNA-binding NtrC family response regulator